MSDIEKVVVYQKDTGMVVSSGSCQMPWLIETPLLGVLIGAQAAPGQSYVEQGVVQEIPPRPGDPYVFDWTLKQWTDPRTLQDLKDAKWADIKRARDAAEYGGFTWDGSTFDSDAISQARIQGAVQLAGMAPGFSIDWTLASNAVRTLSAADMLAVGAALGLHVATQFSLARVLRAAIESATADQLSEVAWPAN